MTNYATGHFAEQVAAEYLQKLGYTIIEQNWRTKYCEIDIVAQSNETIYFTEVKHRNSSSHGTGLDYITPKKLKQMSFAAEMWVHKNNWLHEYTLSAIELSGTPPRVTDFLSNL